MSHSWLVLPNVWLCRPIGKVALSILMSSTWANTQHVFHWIRTSQTSFMSSTWANTQSTGSYDKQPDYSPVVKNLSVVPLSIGDKIACRLINTTSSHYHRDSPLERDHLPPHRAPFMSTSPPHLLILTTFVSFARNARKSFANNDIYKRFISLCKLWSSRLAQRKLWSSRLAQRMTLIIG